MSGTQFISLDERGQDVANRRQRRELAEGRNEGSLHPRERRQSRKRWNRETVEFRGEPVERRGESIELRGESVELRGEPIELRGESVELRGESI